MAKSKARKKVVTKSVKNVSKKAAKKVAKPLAKKPAAKAAKPKASQPVSPADIRLPITPPVRVSARRQASLFPRELPPFRG